MADINLLPVEEKANEQLQSASQKIRIFTIAGLILTIIALLVTLGLLTSAASREKELRGEKQSKIDEINSHALLEQFLRVTKSKTSEAERLLAGRANHAEVFERLAELVPQNVYFNQIRFEEETVSVSGVAANSTEMAGMVSSFLGEGSDLVTSLSVDGLNKGSEGSYQFSMTLNLKL